MFYVFFIFFIVKKEIKHILHIIFVLFVFQNKKLSSKTINKQTLDIEKTLQEVESMAAVIDHS